MLRKMNNVFVEGTGEVLHGVNVCEYESRLDDPNRRKSLVHFIDTEGYPKTYYKSHLLGKGVSGQAWLFVDDEKNPQDQVVIKEEAYISGSGYRRVLLRELPFCQLQFNNRAAFAGDFSNRFQPFRIAMPFIPGKTLTDFVIRSPLDFFKVMISMVKNLMKIHQSKFIHGDMHQNNVLINEDREAVFFDFSNSVYMDRDNKAPGFGENLTAWIAPEWKQQTEPKAELDIYGLGYLIKYKLSKTSIFSSETRNNILVMVAQLLDKDPNHRICLDRVLAIFEESYRQCDVHYQRISSQVKTVYEALSNQKLTLEQLKKLNLCRLYLDNLSKQDYTENELFEIENEMTKVQKGEEKAWGSSQIPVIGIGGYVKENFSRIVKELSPMERNAFLNELSDYHFRHECVDTLEALQTCYTCLDEKERNQWIGRLSFEHIKELVDAKGSDIEKFGEHKKSFLNWFVNEVYHRNKNQKDPFEWVLSYLDTLTLSHSTKKDILKIMNVLYYTARSGNSKDYTGWKFFGYNRQSKLDASNAMAKALECSDKRQMNEILAKHLGPLQDGNLKAIFKRI